MFWKLVITFIVLTINAYCDDKICIENNFPSFLCNTTFSDPRYLKNSKDNVVHIGVSLKIINKSNNKEKKTDFDGPFKVKLLCLKIETMGNEIMFQDNIKVFFSHLLQLSTGATQHWIILTDKNSINILNDLIRNIITRHITDNLLKTWEGRRGARRVPKIVIDYVDLDSLASSELETNFMKALSSFNLDKENESNKYLDKLFFLGPLYHLIFPNLKKLIFMDVDLSITINIKQLYQQFSQFSDNNMIGVAYDLSPHYRQNLEQYRRWHPESNLGDPGETQVKL